MLDLSLAFAGKRRGKKSAQNCGTHTCPGEGGDPSIPAGAGDICDEALHPLSPLVAMGLSTNMATVQRANQLILGYIGLLKWHS